MGCETDEWRTCELRALCFYIGFLGFRVLGGCYKAGVVDAGNRAVVDKCMLLVLYLLLDFVEKRVWYPIAAVGSAGRWAGEGSKG